MINESSPVKVKDIIQYLQENFDDTTDVWLDKDGWQCGTITNSQQIIGQSGVFEKFKNDLFINN